MKAAKYGAVVAFLFLAAVIPFLAETYIVSLVLFMLMYVALAGSWNIISGFTGYVSFGHVAFWGVGSYTAAVLITRYGASWPVASLAAGGLAVLLAILLGYPCLRLKGPYFAIAMLGLSEAVRVIVNVWKSVTHGGEGLSLPPVLNVVPMYYGMAACALGTILLTYKIATSKFGLRLIAIREDETAAEVMGINTTRYKLIAFMLSAFFPGVVGGIYARYVSYIEPETSFTILVTIQMIIMAIFGGRATVMGPVIGAVSLYLLAELVWVRFPNVHLAAYGMLVIIVVLFMPQGVMGLLKQKGLVSGRRLLVATS